MCSKIILISVLVLFCLSIETSCIGLSLLSSPLTREAQKENQKYWEFAYINCGESNLGFDGADFAELKGVSFSVQEQRLSGLDKENGYEWKGFGFIYFTKKRKYFSRVWHDWQSGGTEKTTIFKKNGEWIVPQHLVRNVTCDLLD